MKKLIQNQILSNVFWLFLDKGYGALLSLFIYSKMAKYFGTSVFGIWNYIISFSAIIPAISSLGLNYIIVKRLKRNPLLSNSIVSISFYLRIIVGVLVGIIMFALYALLDVNFQNELIGTIILLFGSQIILNINIVIQINEANLQNRRTVIARIIPLTIFFIFKLLGIEFEFGLNYFALMMFLEYSLFFYLISRNENLNLNIPDKKIIKKITSSLLKEGLPLMLAAITTTLYLKIDQIFIAFFLDNKNVGVYASSVRISEFLYAIPVIISSVYFPKIMKVFKADLDKLLYQMFGITIAISLICICLITLFSEEIIFYVYGDDYLEASKVLNIHVWSILMISLLVTSSKCILKVNRQDIIFKREILGLTANVLLNFILIPKYGVYGAAFATLASYAISSFFSNFLFHPTRPIMRKQLLSIFYLFKVLRS